MTYLRQLWEAIRPRTIRELEEMYLAKSSSLVDLERRQRKLMRGQAPFQRDYKFLK